MTKEEWINLKPGDVIVVACSGSFVPKGTRLQIVQKNGSNWIYRFLPPFPKKMPDDLTYSISACSDYCLESTVPKVCI